MPPCRLVLMSHPMTGGYPQGDAVLGTDARATHEQVEDVEQQGAEGFHRAGELSEGMSNFLAAKVRLFSHTKK